MEKCLKLGQNSAYSTHWNNGRIVMEYLLCPNNHLLCRVCGTEKSLKIMCSSFAYWVRNLSLLLIFASFLACTTSVGQKITMRPQFVPNARRRDESMQLVPRASRKKNIRDIRRAVKSPCPGILTANILTTTDKSNERLLRLDTG